MSPDNHPFFGVQLRSGRRLIFALTLTAALLAAGQTTVLAQSAATSERSTSILGNGLIVESISKNSEAQKGGLRPGDVLLRWSRGDYSGIFNSPFDVPYVRFEQASRGPVTIVGLRGARPRKWRLGSDVWGIATRPNFFEPLLSLYREGNVLLVAGKRIEAARQWCTTATLLQQHGIAWLAPWFYSRAAHVFFDAAQWDLVEDAYQKATKGTPDPGPIVKAELYRQWAAGFNYRDDLVSAEKYYNEVLLQWQQLGAHLMTDANALFQLADVELQLGELDKAEEYLRRASSLAEELAPRSYQAALILANLGVLFEDRGDLSKAEEYYLKSLAKEERYFPGTVHVAHTLAALGTLAHQRRDFLSAEAYYHRALTLAAKLDRESLDVAQILSDLSECILEQQESLKAEEYENRALLIRKKLLPEGLATAFSLARLGKIARVRGDLTKAESYYQQALAITDKIHAPERDHARFIMGEAEVLRQRRDFPNAEKLYLQASEIIQKIAPESMDHAEILGALAGIIRHEGNLEVAAQLYKQALDLLERKATHLTEAAEQRSRYRTWESRYSQQYADLLLKQGKIELAFEVSERFRARTFVEMLAQADINLSGDADATLLGRERKLRQLIEAKSEYRLRLINDLSAGAQLSALESEIEQLILRDQQVIAELRVSNPNYDSLTQPPSIGIAEIQGLLDSNTLLLEYSLGEERSHVWVIDEKSLTAYELPNQKEINRAARLVHKLLSTQTQGINSDERPARTETTSNYLLAARRLSRMILGPIAGLLNGKRLLIVADGALQYVPFSALPEPNERILSVPLIVNHEIVNLPAASILAELRRQPIGRPRPTGMVAVLADPVFDSKDERLRAANKQLSSVNPSQQRISDLTRSADDVGLAINGMLKFNRLLYTRNEADGIMAVTPPGKGMEALDFQASRSTAMSGELARYRIVHFATHGMLNNKRPELSGLVLSLVNEHGKSQDGFLKLHDIYNLKLPVELVVLSGCQTGLGEEIEGEGLIGLTRAFMYAGATRVVASLWSVSDMATAKLMAEFYRAMEHDGIRPAAALRAAQIKMWKTKQWNLPYYWAAFEIQGDWQ